MLTPAAVAHAPRPWIVNSVSSPRNSTTSGAGGRVEDGAVRMNVASAPEQGHRPGVPNLHDKGGAMVYTVENTWKDLHDAGVQTAIVTVGAIEQHGHHLPLGTDWIIGDHMARALAEALDEDVYVLP